MAFITRQPNGLLCRFSTIADCITHYNMTDEEYVELCGKEAMDAARMDLKAAGFLKPYEWIDEYFRPDNMTRAQYKEIKKQMEEPVT